MGRSGGIGRRAAFRAQFSSGSVGSTPTFGTRGHLCQSRLAAIMTEADSNSPLQSGILGKRSKERRLSSAQILFAVILSVGLMLTLNFSSRIQADRELQRIHQQVLQEIELLEEQQMQLRAELDYVKGDAYVEMWARDEGKMIRENEVLALLQRVESGAAARATAVSPVEFQTKPPEPENWELWWALFFDGPPIQLN